MPPPQIASLPAPKKEQLDPPEGPRLWGLSACKVGSGRLQQVEEGLERAVSPEPRGMATLGRWGTQCQCRHERGSWPFQEPSGRDLGVLLAPRFGLRWGGLWALMCA